MANFVRVTSYVPGQSRRKFVLLVQHDGDGRDILSRHPNIASELNTPRNFFDRYLLIERDVGTSELAHAIAAKLHSDAIVVECTLPRGLVDPNRSSAHALPSVLNLDPNHPLAKILLDAHTQAIQEIQRVLREADPVLYLDVHSMSPYSLDPRKAPAAGFSSIARHVTGWLSFQGAPRSVDIITSTPESEVLADLRLATVIESAFSGLGISTIRNYPFCAINQITGTQYLRTHPGLAVDVPKTHLTSGDALDQLKVDFDKIDLLASAIADRLNVLLASLV
ncbi:hypothetical protein HY990_01760 [Candidatus Micrarchaeota archaeon]|nr:hypothetical protein [Candidatus Micrarchaeota archaeon]